MDMVSGYAEKETLSVIEQFIITDCFEKKEILDRYLMLDPFQTSSICRIQ